MKTQAIFVISLIGLGNTLALPALAGEGCLFPQFGSGFKPCRNTGCTGSTRACYDPRVDMCVCETQNISKRRALSARDVSDDTSLDCSQSEDLCILEQQKVYHPELGHCVCDWIPGLEPHDPSEKRETSPAQPLAARDEVTSDTSLDCSQSPHSSCILEQEKVYHPELGHCVCDWIPGLEPHDSTEKRETTPAQPLVERDGVTSDTSLDCSQSPHSWCILEQEKVYHPELGHCVCDWIPGLEPHDPNEQVKRRDTPEMCGAIEVICLTTPDQKLVWDPVTERCTCPPATGA